VCNLDPFILADSSWTSISHSLACCSLVVYVLGRHFCYVSKFLSTRVVQQIPLVLNSQMSNIADLSTEDRIKLAIEAIERSGVKSNGDANYSIRAAAKDFNIPRSTLGNRVKGMLHCFQSLTMLNTIQVEFLEKRLIFMSSFCRHPKKKFLWNGLKFRAGVESR